MISFYSISQFVGKIETLLKTKRGVYSSVQSETNQEFEGKTIDDIRSNRDMILMENEALVIKLRLPDKKHKLSKKDGFRLIYLVSRTRETVVFLDIYPKRGSLQQISISDKRLVELLTMFSDEVQMQKLVQYVFA